MEIKKCRLQDLEASLSGENPDIGTENFHLILSELAVEHGVEWVLTEHPYIDRDFKNEHGALFTHQFRTIPNVCIRVHFFVREPHVPYRDCADAYRGYMVLRPLPSAMIGRTVLPVPKRKIYGATQLITTAAQFQPHLLDDTMSIYGTPFCEQDGMMMRCAQAALWVTTRVMYKKFRTELHFTNDINEAAVEGFRTAGRTFPLDGGLQIGEMVNALNHLGFYPQLIEGHRGLELSELLSVSVPYVTSGLPVILGLPEHVVAAIGVLISSRKLSRGNHMDALQSFEDWVAGFVVHDDAAGPYRIMPRQKWLTKKKASALGTLLRVPGKIEESDTGDVDAALIPCIKEMWLSISDARDQAKRFLFAAPFWNFVSDATAGLYPKSLDALVAESGTPLVIRWRIVSSKLFKEDAIPKGSELRERMGGVHMPRYVWLGELFWARDMSRPVEEWQVCGEVIIDATSNQHYPSVLVIHLPKLLYLRDPNGGWGDCFGQNPSKATILRLAKDVPRPDVLDFH